MLSQEDLAERSTLSVRAIRNLERGSVACPRTDSAVLLADALELSGLARAEFLATASPEAMAATLCRGLPGRVKVFGRDAELAALTRHLADGAGVVTLTGLAGVGKTALGVAVAHEFASAVGSRIAFVELADDLPADELVNTVVSRFGGVAAATLADRLWGGPGLLVLDGAEHASCAAEVVLRLRAECPWIQVLATSRRRLRIMGEREWPVAALEVPADFGELSDVPAAQLFVATVRLFRPTATLDPADAVPLAALLRRLGGLPLAIELAAHRSRLMSVSEILARHSDDLLSLADGSLARPRDHITLRQAIDASYVLLSDTAQRALRWLSVWASAWTLELAERYLQGHTQPLASLEELHEHGFLRSAEVSHLGVARWCLLDVIKEFGWEELQRRGEMEKARLCHAQQIADRLSTLGTSFLLPGGSEDLASIATIGEIGSDLRTAIDWAILNHPPVALSLVTRACGYWVQRGQVRHALAALQHVLSVCDATSANTDHADAARPTLAALLFLVGDHDKALTETRRAWPIVSQPGQEENALIARAVRTRVSMVVAEAATAQREAEEYLQLARNVGDARSHCGALVMMAQLHANVANLDQARDVLQQARSVAGQHGLSYFDSFCRALLAAWAVREGNFIAAERLAMEALRQQGKSSPSRQSVALLSLLCESIARQGEPERARQSLSQAQQAAASLDTSGAAMAVHMASGYVALADTQFIDAHKAFTSALAVPGLPEAKASAYLGLIQARAGDSAGQRAARGELAALCERHGYRLTTFERSLCDHRHPPPR